MLECWGTGRNNLISKPRFDGGRFSKDVWNCWIGFLRILEDRIRDPGILHHQLPVICCSPALLPITSWLQISGIAKYSGRYPKLGWEAFGWMPGFASSRALRVPMGDVEHWTFLFQPRTKFTVIVLKVKISDDVGQTWFIGEPVKCFFIVLISGERYFCQVWRGRPGQLTFVEAAARR